MVRLKCIFKKGSILLPSDGAGNVCHFQPRRVNFTRSTTLHLLPHNVAQLDTLSAARSLTYYFGTQGRRPRLHSPRQVNNYRACCHLAVGNQVLSLLFRFDFHGSAERSIVLGDRDGRPSRNLHVPRPLCGHLLGRCVVLLQPEYSSNDWGRIDRPTETKARVSKSQMSEW